MPLAGRSIAGCNVVAGPGRNSAADVEVDGFEDLGLLVTQTSGFDSALRVLEAVATEGRDWIVRDEERKRRWARNWSR